MVSIKFTTLLLGLFTTCFILVAPLHLKHGDVHRDASTDVASSEGVVFTSVGERKILFRERKFLRHSKAAVDGSSSSYKINEDGDSKSSGAVQHELNVKCDQTRAKRSSKLSQRNTKKAGKTSSSKPSDCSISKLNFQVKTDVVGALKSSSSSQNEPVVPRPKSVKAQKEVDQEQKFHNNAANQLVNFLHKDYGGMDMPFRKPPVHNGEPFH